MVLCSATLNPCGGGIGRFGLLETRYPLEMESQFHSSGPRLESMTLVVLHGLQMYLPDLTPLLVIVAHLPWALVESRYFGYDIDYKSVEQRYG